MNKIHGAPKQSVALHSSLSFDEIATVGVWEQIRKLRLEFYNNKKVREGRRINCFDWMNGYDILQQR